MNVIETVEQLVERERRLQSELAGRVFAPVDAIFDLLADSGATLRRQAEALEAAGHALEETAVLMRRQAEHFERAVAVIRQPTELAKSASGAKRARRD